MPPVGFEELFGNSNSNEQNEEWEDASLIKNESEEMRRANTIKRGIFFDENEENFDDELKDFDPLGDLAASIKLGDKGLDA